MDFDSLMMDTTFSRKIGMTYRYSSSSDDSLNLHDDPGASNAVSTASFYGGSSSLGKKSTDFENKAPLIPPRTPIFRGSTIRNSSVTPPPCVLRRMRRDFSASNTPRSSKDFDADMGMGLDLESFLPEMSGGTRRTSSGSSLSTLTAEPRNSAQSSNHNHGGHGSHGNSNKNGHGTQIQSVPPFSRHISFSSLQRAPKHHQQQFSDNLYQTINNGSLSRGSSSANASPLMTSHRHHSGHASAASSSNNGMSSVNANNNSGGIFRAGGHFGGGHSHHSHSHSNSSSGSGGGANVNGSSGPIGNIGPAFGGGGVGVGGSGNGGGGGGASRTSPLERNIQTLKQDLGAVVLETRQLDVDMSSLRQDVGSVQENIATVRGTLDLTRERVGRLTNQVNNIERQIQSAIKEASLMREEAGKLLEDAETSKATHEHLQEEAENLMSFLRQMACCSRNHFCSNSNSSFNGGGQSCGSNPTGGTLMGNKFCPQPMPRKSKTPERMLDDPDPPEPNPNPTPTSADNNGLCHPGHHFHSHEDSMMVMIGASEKKRGSVGVTFANVDNVIQVENSSHMMNSCNNSGCANNANNVHSNNSMMNGNGTEREMSKSGRQLSKTLTDNNREREMLETSKKTKDFQDESDPEIENHLKNQNEDDTDDDQSRDIDLDDNDNISEISLLAEI